MVGPSFGHIATSIVALLLVEKVTIDYIAPFTIPTMEEYFAYFGREKAAALGGILQGSVSFWAVGGLMALPAIFKVKQWKIQVNKDLDINKLRKSMPLIAFNWLLGTVFATPILLYCLPARSWDFRNLPSTNTLLRDIIVWMVVEETMFYYVHRLFHVNKKMYHHIHKMHHTWTSPISFVAIYCHPVEHILSNISPLILGPVLCGSHLFAIGAYLFIAQVHTLTVHSGYWFCDDNGMHDEHHRSFNYNYGVLGVLDMLHGTYKFAPGAHGESTAGKTQ
jgi:methylsterol monooxygenase